MSINLYIRKKSGDRYEYIALGKALSKYHQYVEACSKDEFRKDAIRTFEEWLKSE